MYECCRGASPPEKPGLVASRLKFLVQGGGFNFFSNLTSILRQIVCFSHQLVVGQPKTERTNFRVDEEICFQANRRNFLVLKIGFLERK